MKATLHYIVLVGIPVIVVLILLRIGENTLTVPVSVGGNWQLAFPSKPGSESCFDFSFGTEDPMLNISQSGRYLVLTFNDEKHSTLNGTLTDLNVLANNPDASSSTTPEMSLSLTIHREAEPDQLEGALKQASCEETWIITATRQPALHQTGGH